MPIDRAFVSLDEGQVLYRRVICPQAGVNPLLLLHASPTSSWFLQGLMRALQDEGCHRTLIAPDTLGNGDSDNPATERPDIAYFADSMRRFLDTLEIPTVDLYGSHTGARIACEFAAAFPERVGRVIFDGIMEYDEQTRRLVVENYAPSVDPDAYGRHLIWAFNFVRDQALYFPYFQRDPEHRLGGAMPDPGVLHRATLDVLKALDSYAKPYIAAFEYPTYDRMPAIQAPVLLLKPDSELPVLNQAVETARRLLRNATVATVQGGDRDKARAIAAFLGKASP